MNDFDGECKPDAEIKIIFNDVFMFQKLRKLKFAMDINVAGTSASNDSELLDSDQTNLFEDCTKELNFSDFDLEFLLSDIEDETKKENKQGNGEQREGIPAFIDIDQVRKREDRVTRALQTIKSIRFTWVESPVKVLQDRLQFLGLD